jgi:hypothetical protein
MDPIRVDNISQYSVKIVDGALVLTPKDPMLQHIKRFKKDLPTRKPAPRTPDPNKCVEKHEEFEDELWIPEGMISRGKTYPLRDRALVPQCKCMKNDAYHDLLEDKEWYRHRKEVNRYRRMCANNRVIKPVNANTLSIPDDDSDDEYSMSNIIRRMDREELMFDLNSKKISFMSGYTDHELRALLMRAYS